MKRVRWHYAAVARPFGATAWQMVARGPNRRKFEREVELRLDELGRVCSGRCVVFEVPADVPDAEVLATVERDFPAEAFH